MILVGPSADEHDPRLVAWKRRENAGLMVSTEALAAVREAEELLDERTRDYLDGPGRELLLTIWGIDSVFRDASSRGNVTGAQRAAERWIGLVREAHAAAYGLGPSSSRFKLIAP